MSTNEPNPAGQSTGPSRRRWLRKAVFALVCGVTLLFLANAIENWRGRRMLAETRHELEALGEKLDWEAFIPAPIPDERNFLKAPGMTELFSRDWSKSNAVPHTVSTPPNVFSIPMRLPDLQRLPLRLSNAVDLAQLSLPGVNNEVMELVEFTNAPVADALTALSKMAGLKLAVDASSFTSPLEGKLSELYPANRPSNVTIRLTNVTAVAALKVVLRDNNLAVIRPSEGAGLRVALNLTVEGFKAWFDQFDEDVRLLRQACERPEAQWRGDLAQPLKMDVANFVSVRRVVQALTSRAAVQLRLGNSEAALADFRLVTRLTGYLRFSHTLVASMIQVATAALNIDVVHDGLEANAWTEPQLAEIENLLREANLIADVTASLRDGERPIIGHVLEQTLQEARSAGTMQLLLQSIGKSPSFDVFPDKTTRWKALLGPSGWIYQNEARYWRYIQMDIETMDPAANRIFPGKVRQATDAIQKELSTASTPYTYLVRIVTPALGKALERVGVVQTQVQQARLACALQRHRLATGTYPERLEELSPRFLAQLPHDIITGQPMHYQRMTDGGYKLWSVGWNEKDDGGEVVTDKNGKSEFNLTKGDWVWLGRTAPAPVNANRASFE